MIADDPRRSNVPHAAIRPTSLRRVMAAVVVIATLVPTTPLLAQGGPPPAPVRADAVRLENVQEQRRVTGELRPLRRSLVASREGGLIVDLPVVEGQHIDRGQPICRLDAKRLELTLAETEAEVALAEATHEERRAELERAASDLTAIEQLAQRDAVNPKELRDARSSVTIATARQLQAERSVAVATARAALLKQRLDDMTVTAPFDGIIVARRAELGQWLAEGAAVIELISRGSLEAWLDVPQEFASAIDGLVKSDEGMRLRVDATGEWRSAASIRAVRAIDQRARTFPLIITLDDDGTVASGMSVTAWVPTGRRGERLTLSRDALMSGPTGAFVYVVRGGDEGRPATVVPASIEVLFEVGDRVAVATRDLRQGDLVVIEGNERLFPGAPVAPRRTEGGRP